MPKSIYFAVLGSLHIFLLQEIHLDLVGFSQPVAIQEVRVISHGCRFHSDIKDKFG